MRGLQVGVDVNRLISRVDEPVEALTAGGERILGVDHEIVLGGEAGHREAAGGGGLVIRECSAVQRDGVHLPGQEIDPARRAGPGAAEADPGPGPKSHAGAFGAGKVEFDVIGVHPQQCAALSGFGLCQRRVRHLADPPWMRYGRLD
jgi:hypothetical protein